MDQKKNTPAGIIIWYILTIMTLMSITPIIFSYITNPLGAALMLLPIYLIACVILTSMRKCRLFIGIGHMVTGAIMTIASIIMFFSMVNCQNTPSCVSGGGLDIIFVLILIWPPATVNLIFGLYFTISRKVKAYFGK